MAAVDLNQKKASGSTKLVGASPAAGSEDNYAEVTANGGLHTNLRDAAGTETGTASNPLKTSVTDSALPAGAATAAKQDTGNTSLGSIDTKLTSQATAANQATGNASLGSIDTKLSSQATAAKQDTGNASLASIDTKLSSQATAAKQDTGNTSLASIDTKLTSQATAAKQDTGNTSLASIDTKLSSQATAAKQDTQTTSLQLIDDLPHAQNATLSKGVPVMGQLDDASTTAATEDAVAVARITPQRAVHTNLRNQAGTEIGTSSNPVRVDPSGTTPQPMTLKGAVDAGNSTTSNLGVGGVYTGAWTDILDYNMVSITVNPDQASATDGLAVQWSNNGSTVHSDDVFTIAANAGKQFSFGRLSRYYRVVYTNGAIAQTSFSMQTVLSTGNFKASTHRIADSLVDDDDAELVKSVIAGKSPTGIYRNVAVDDDGRLITSAITGFNANFAFGDVVLAAASLAPVRRTAYTEQTTNAQRSVASASASDAAAGTGARQVIITYFDAVGAGPFTETVTLNGTTGVNTVSTTICYIEKIQVSSVGSGGVNAGIITLYSAVAKGGVAIGTIAAGDNQTLWAHHYVATGKICNITGFSNSHSGTTVGSGGLFILKAKTIGVATAPELQVSDFNRLYGQDSANPRNYGSPIKVTGPARIICYVTPETTTSTTYRAAIDFFEP